MKRDNCDKERGYALVAVIILSALSILIAASVLQIAQSHTRSTYATKVRSQQYYETEESVNRAVAWLRENSQNLVSPFRRENFYDYFEKGEPTSGLNDSASFQVVSSVKVKSGGSANSSAVLVGNDPDSDLATALFPDTKNITTDAAFDAAANFAAADLGEAKVRITLVNAIAFDEDKDYGPPPAADPDTDFYPVYRIDAMNEIDGGAHVYGTVMGKVIHVFDYGIYGEDALELRQACDSYDSEKGNYSAGTNRNANCHAASNSSAAIHKSEKVYGTLHTNGSITEENPYGGKVCADFDASCANKGETCSGEDCGVPLLEQYAAFDAVCPVTQGNYSTTGNVTLTVAGNNPMQKCWNNVVINNGHTLTLRTTDFPYYFRSIEFKGGNPSLKSDPIVAGKPVQLFIQAIVGDKLNGNQTVNASGRPFQLQVVYLGTNPLVLNGNSSFKMAFVAPNAGVTLSGSADYYGALLSKRLSLTGSGDVHYDESLSGEGPIIDAQYRLRNLVQYYR